MECFGNYDFRKEECLSCTRRIECMIQKFERRKGDTWFDSSDTPNCYGSYEGYEDCKECPFQKECINFTESLKRRLERKGKKIRLQGKYKERGSWGRKS